MKAFKVEGAPMRFGSGAKLGLSDAQLATRTHAVEPIADSEDGKRHFVRVIQPVEFKVGEELFVDDGTVPKGATNPLTGERQSNGDRRRAGTAKTAAAKAPKAKK